MFTDALLTVVRVLPAWAYVLTVIVLVFGCVAIRLVRRLKDFTPQDSGDRLAVWRLWFGYRRQRQQERHERWLVRTERKAIQAKGRASRRRRG